jgi:hypothetical protein
MTLVARESTNLLRHRVEMRASIIFDVILPEAASERDVVAQATRDYHNAVDNKGGFTVQIGLPDCRLYIYTLDNWDPAELGIVDTETFDKDDEEC